MLGLHKKGSHFGDVGCLTGHPRAYTVVSLTFSELFSLHRDDIRPILEQWPEVWEQMSRTIDYMEQVLHSAGVAQSGVPELVRRASDG